MIQLSVDFGGLSATKYAGFGAGIGKIMKNTFPEDLKKGAIF